MKILITGITGFVGEYLAKEIQENNPDAAIFGLDKTKKHFKLFPELNSKTKIFECDITDKNKVKQIVNKIKPDQVYHLAGYSSSKATDEQLVYKINVNGTVNILEALRNLEKDTRIILVSSAHVYGETIKPATEKDKTKPVSIYGRSKLEMEKRALAFVGKLEIIIVRPVNHVGPGQRMGFLIPDITNRILQSTKSIEVYNPKVEKDFSDVRDVVKAYTLLMSHGKPGEIYNIGSGKTITIGRITEKLMAMADKKLKMEFRQVPEKLNINCVNPAKIKKLGWKPKYKLEETLKNIYQYWKEYKE